MTSQGGRQGFTNGDESRIISLYNHGVPSTRSLELTSPSPAMDGPVEPSATYAEEIPNEASMEILFLPGPRRDSLYEHLAELRHPGGRPTSAMIQNGSTSAFVTAARARLASASRVNGTLTQPMYPQPDLGNRAASNPSVSGSSINRPTTGDSTSVSSIVDMYGLPSIVRTNTQNRNQSGSSQDGATNRSVSGGSATLVRTIRSQRENLELSGSIPRCPVIPNMPLLVEAYKEKRRIERLRAERSPHHTRDRSFGDDTRSSYSEYNTQSSSPFYMNRMGQTVAPIKDSATQTTPVRLMKALPPIPTNEGMGGLSSTSTRASSIPSRLGHIQAGDRMAEEQSRSSSCPRKLAGQDASISAWVDPFQQTDGSKVPFANMSYPNAYGTVRRYSRAADPDAMNNIMREPPKDLFTTPQPKVSMIFDRDGNPHELKSILKPPTREFVKYFGPDSDDNSMLDGRGKMLGHGTGGSGGGGEVKSFFSTSSSSKKSSSLRKGLKKRLSNLRDMVKKTRSPFSTHSSSHSAQADGGGQAERSQRSQSPTLSVGSLTTLTNYSAVTDSTTAAGCNSRSHRRSSFRKTLSKWAKGMGRAVSGKRRS